MQLRLIARKIAHCQPRRVLSIAAIAWAIETGATACSSPAPVGTTDGASAPGVFAEAGTGDAPLGETGIVIGPDATGLADVSLALDDASGDGNTSQPGDAPPAPAPDFGANVFIFDPSMPMAMIQNRIDTIYSQQSGGQFNTNRYTFMFKPGQYNLDVKVGYYTQVIGLGQLPDDVVITGSVRSGGVNGGNATLSFWRSCENLTVIPSAATANVNMWAGSQGATFRRVQVQGSLTLADTGTSSGGSWQTPESTVMCFLALNSSGSRATANGSVG